MKKIYLILILFLFVWVEAQIQQGGLPVSLTDYNTNKTTPYIYTPNTNVSALRQEDEVVDQIKDIPWRYGYIHYVDVSLEDGVFETLPNGDRLWRVNIQSPGAQTVNFTFDKYHLAEGTKLFIYTQNYERVIGAFTHANNKAHGFLTTTLIEGEEATLELYEPKGLIGQSELHLQRVVHGYRSLDFKKKYIGDSGNCNNNVVCPEGDNWRDQIRSVGILLSQDNLSAGFCTGALINNACNEEKAYFLTANHCGADDPTTVVGFNFESTTCVNNSGPYLDNTVSGVSVKASNGGSDFMLLELSSLPPASYNVFYSGWDRSSTPPNGQVGIHHPAGDLKKISFDNEAAVNGNFSGAQCWRVLDWEDGTTEGGSSGSPLYNLAGNIIGQLYGGTANCSNNIDDYYGRFDISWDGGSNANNELKTWLDACNTGVISLPGYDPNAISLAEDAALGFSGVLGGSICGDKFGQALTIRNRGVQDLISAEIRYGVSGNMQTFNWNGLLNSSQSETISLDSLNLSSGNYSYEAYLVLTNLIQDEDLTNDSLTFPISITEGTSVIVNLATNFEADENTFSIIDGQGNVVAFEDDFDNNDSYTFEYCLPQGSYCIIIEDEGEDGLSPSFFFDQGNYQLIVGGIEVFNGDDIGGSYEYCIEGEIDDTTGLSGSTNQVSFNLYPNPTSEGFTVETKENINRVQLYDIIGTKVYDRELENEQTYVSTQGLARGVFLVKVFSNKGTGIAKVLVK